MSRTVFVLLTLLVLAGCAASGFTTSSSGPRKAGEPEIVVVEVDPEEVRAAQLRKQAREIQELRDVLDANRARSDAATERMNAATLQAQSEMRALESELAEVRVRADAASAQSDKAFAIATEFLSNLIAAREEQRSIVERNISVFDRMEQRLVAIEGRIQETRQLGQAELAATRTRSTDLEQRLQGADQELLDLREQLLQLHRSNEETRAVIDSGPMLDMLRQLEGTQRDTSGLRGALEETRLEQQAARKRMQDYYLDLDARIQDLQDRERAAREAEAQLDEVDTANRSAPDLSDDAVAAPVTEDMDAAGRAAAERDANTDAVGTESSVSMPLELPDEIEAIPLREESLPDPSVETDGSVPASNASPAAGVDTIDDAVVDEMVPDKVLLPTDSEQLDQGGIDHPALDGTGDSPDALPEIVDTMDIMPGEPSVQDETVPEAGEAGRQNMEEGGMEESGVAPDSQSPLVDRHRESTRRLPVERHAVIVTDWTHDAEARGTLDNRSLQ